MEGEGTQQTHNYYSLPHVRRDLCVELSSSRARGNDLTTWRSVPFLDDKKSIVHSIKTSIGVAWKRSGSAHPSLGGWELYLTGYIRISTLQSRRTKTRE